jgi:uncharacterized protein YjaG (DUF416 family)
VTDSGVSALRGRKAAAFACACAQRLLPFYERFRSETGWDSGAALADILRKLWSALEDPARSSELDVVVDPLAPHADDFDSCLITAAQNCCICVDTALGYVGTVRAVDVNIAAVPDYVLDAIVSVELCESAGYLSAGDDPRLLEAEQNILLGKSIRVEQDLQRRHLEILAAAKQLTADIVRSLRSSSGG